MTVPNRQFTFTSSQPAYRHFSPRLSQGSNTACKPPSFLKLETVLAGQNPGSSTVEWPAVWPCLAVAYWDLGSTFWDMLFSCLLIPGLHTDSMDRETQSTTTWLYVLQSLFSAVETSAQTFLCQKSLSLKCIYFCFTYMSILPARTSVCTSMSRSPWKLENELDPLEL